MTPPGLAWLDAFARSTGIALGQGIIAEAETTVNPLVYVVSARWTDPISTTAAMLVWNLFQRWAGTNASTPQGDVVFREVCTPYSTLIRGFEVKVHLRERLGLPRNRHPK